MELAGRLELFRNCRFRRGRRRLLCQVVHPAARLRPRILFRQCARESLAGRLPGPHYDVPVLLLEKDARRAPRDFRQPGPACAGRYPHAHRAGIPRQLAPGTAGVSRLSQRAGDVGNRAAVPVRGKTSAADRNAVALEKGMAQRGAQQCRAHDHARRVGALARLARVAGRSPAHHRGGRCRRRLAVLRSAHLRRRLLDARRAVGPGARQPSTAVRSTTFRSCCAG